METKYAIRVISQEDTIKSKVFEDFDKAIEMASYIYNEFADLDFGDEVVVIKESTVKSSLKNYLWANGQMLHYPSQELKIGDKVSVIDTGFTYSSYRDFIEEYGTKEQIDHWVWGVTPLKRRTYIIENILPHLSMSNVKICIIKEISTHRIFLIGIEGLTKYYGKN